MGRIARSFAAILICAMLLHASPPRASACSCAAPDGNEQRVRHLVESADAVVIARVDHNSTVTDPNDRLRVRALVTVRLVYKGPVAARFDVQTAPNGEACGYPEIREPGPHLMILQKTDSGFTTGLCDAFPVSYDEASGVVSSKVSQDFVATLTRIAPPHPPPESLPTPRTGFANDIESRDADGPWREVIAIALGGTLLLLGCVVLLTVRGRRRHRP